MLGLSEALAARDAADAVVVQGCPADIGFEPQAFECVALLDRNRALRDDRPPVDLFRGKVDRYPDRRLASENFPIANRPAPSIFRDFALVNVECPIRWDRDHRLMKN